MTSESLTTLAEAINTLASPSPEEFKVPTVSVMTYANTATKFRVELWRFMKAVEKLPGGDNLLNETCVVEKFIELDLMRNDALAHELHVYMAFRAKREGKPHRHDVSYYSNILLNQRKARLRKRIAGVRIGDHSLLSDATNPEAFDAWHDSHRHHALFGSGKKKVRRAGDKSAGAAKSAKRAVKS